MPAHSPFSTQLRLFDDRHWRLRVQHHIASQATVRADLCAASSSLLQVTIADV